MTDKISKEDIFSSCQEFIDWFKAHSVSTIEGTRGDSNYLIDLFYQVYLHRLINLSESTLRMFQENNLVPGVILARACSETVAMYSYLLSKLDKSIKGDTGDMAFDAEVMLHKSLFGSRNKTTTTESVQILNAVDQVDKEYKSYRETYDFFSEFAHPNVASGIGAYSSFDRETKQLKKLGQNPDGVPIEAFGLADFQWILGIGKEQLKKFSNVRDKYIDFINGKRN